MAQSVASPAGSRFVLAGNIRARFPGNPPGRPRRPPPILRALGILDADIQTQVLRILAVFLTAGLVCYGLACYLTAPLKKLRAATRKLTDGEPGGPGRKISRADAKTSLPNSATISTRWPSASRPWWTLSVAC